MLPLKTRAAFLLVGFDGAEGVCKWQTEALQDEVQSEGCRMMETDGARFRNAGGAKSEDRSGSKTRFGNRRSLPPDYSTIQCRCCFERRNGCGAEVFGRAGQGVLYFRLSADSHQKSGKGPGELRSQLSQFISDGIGGLSVYESGQGNVSLGGSANASLVQKLLLAFDPGQKFAY